MPEFAIAPVLQGGADWAGARPVPTLPLTPTQIKILTFVHKYQQMWGASPLYREIARACDLASATSVAYQIRRLAELGAIRKPARLHRAIRLTVVPVSCGP